VLLAAVLAGALASCAAVPTGGGPQKVAGGSGQPQAYALPMPPPAPQAGWTEDDVVLGFLHASASFAANWAAARQYLANPLRQSWRPRADTVVVSASGNRAGPANPDRQGHFYRPAASYADRLGSISVRTRQSSL
jgi:hypothetical protein